MDAPDIPPPPTRQVHLKPTSVNHTIQVPNLSFLHPAHPHDTHTAAVVFKYYHYATVWMTMHNTLWKSMAP